MRKIYSILIVAILVCFSALQTYAIEFTDVGGSQYEASILFLANRGIVKGYPDGTYGVNKPISRAELLKIIIEGLSIPTSGDQYKNCFSDIRDERYAPYVCYAKINGIAKGYPDGTFKPDNNVTIAEGLKMTLNTFDVGVKEGTGSERYMPYMDFVHHNTIFSKYAIYPWSNLTRGQMAYLVHKLILNKEGTKTFTNVREVGSIGCGVNPPSIAPSSSVVDGVARNYITAVGKNYNPNIPTKLIFAIHGRTNPNTQVRGYYKVEQASQGNAIVVYPSGLPEAGPSRNWADGGDKLTDLRDFALFDQLVKEFEQNYCINTDEIYVVGHSLGGWFTNALGCMRGDVIRGIGAVGSSSIGANALCTGPVDALIAHNSQDTLAPFAGGEAMRDLFLKNNGCDVNTARSYTSPDTANCVAYSCASGAEVVWCPFTDSIDERGVFYPHLRPKYAGTLIWDFWSNSIK